MDFIGTTKEHHYMPKKIFKPEYSINNTQQWKKYPEYEKDMKDPFLGIAESIGYFKAVSDLA